MFRQSITPARAKMAKSIMSVLMGRGTLAALLRLGTGIRHSRFSGLSGFPVARCGRFFCSWRNRPEGNPIAKTQVAIARGGEVKASWTSSRGEAPKSLHQSRLISYIEDVCYTYNRQNRWQQRSNIRSTLHPRRKITRQMIQRTPQQRRTVSISEPRQRIRFET